MSLVERIETLFIWRGQQIRLDDGAVPMSVLEHALQTAQYAEWDGAGEALVAAALLHDLGRLLPTPPGADPLDDVHELRAVAYLAESMPAEVVEPIRLHVQAKRYLASRQSGYALCLSEAGRDALARQGGPMSEFERALFEELPYATDAIRVRHWDDAARHPGRRTAPLACYLPMLEALEATAAAPARPSRIEIASPSIT